MTTLRGIIFAPKVIHLLHERFDGFFREKNEGIVSNRLSREQLGAEFSMRIRDLEPHVSQEENETVTAKAGLVEETKKAHSDDTAKILSEATKTARPSNRRRKIRVYFPSATHTHR